MAVKLASVKARHPQQPARQYLFGVQGLRTVAALLVAVYHIWFHRVSGGVDVFFVVAGFFAAGSLLRLFSNAGGLRSGVVAYGRYLLRTARRVVPSAVVVIVATVGGALLWMPRAYWADNIPHGWASLGFWENWHLIASSADYLQQDLGASPFQQFWALAVNVQFYVLFASFVLLLAFLVWARPSRVFDRKFRRALLIGISVVFLGSLAFSVVYTAKDQPAAYFNTFTRLWEFMAGSLAFLLLRSPVRRVGLARASGWVGLLALLSFGALFDLSELLPGFLSVVPVLAALGLIWSSMAKVEPKVLIWKPSLWVADASFAFYLWHWPLLVFYRYQYGEQVGLLPGLGIIGVSLVLAVATTKFIEDPIRKSKLLTHNAWVSLLVILALIGLAAAAIWGWEEKPQRTGGAALPATESQLETEGSDPETEGEIRQDIRLLTPRLENARADTSQANELGCHVKVTDSTLIACEWGDPGASSTVVLVGGSHSLMWLEAVIPGAEAAGAKVVSYTKGNCQFGDVEQFGFERDPSCIEWNDELLKTLLAEPPDLVVTIGTRRVDGVEEVLPGYRSYFELFSELGIPVLAIRDSPTFEFDPLVCLEEEDWEICSSPATDHYVPLEQLSFPELEGIHFLDTSAVLCPAGTCSVVDGHLLQYRDTNHLTTTWVKEKGDFVGNAVAKVLEESAAE